MENYEIRLLNGEAERALVYSSAQASDFAAIRRAQTLAGRCDAVEVWRGMTCIYSARQSELQN